MTAAAPVVEFEAVSKTYPAVGAPVHALREASFRIARGDFAVITGPSGSGKSTLLHLAALLDTPTTGHIHFEGKPVAGLPEPALCDLRKRRVGMVFQKYCLLPHRSARENVMFRYRYVRHSPHEAQAQVRQALRTMNIEDIAERPARLLSGGEMQRVAIARAVALPPSLLLADEPTGNLDHAASTLVMESFSRLHAQGLTILMVTHNESLLKYATRHIVCERGEVREA